MTDKELFTIESAYILPRVKELIKRCGTMRAASFAIVKYGGKGTASAAKCAMASTLKRVYTTKPPKHWALPWPYDFENDRPRADNAEGFTDEPESGNDLNVSDDGGKAPRDFASLTDAFVLAQKEKKKLDAQARNVVVDWSVKNLPVLVFQHTDVHWGADNTDYEAIKRHIGFAKNIPDCYIFATGDFNEFAKVKHRGALEASVHGPSVQARAVRSTFLEVWDRILAVVLGNHDERIFAETGFDIGEYLVGEPPLGKKRIPYLRDGGLVTIRLGLQTYTNNVFHGDSSFGTRFNENHKGRQTARLVDGRCDVTWNGHTHNPAVQDASEPSDDMAGSRDALYIQGGSYKLNDYHGHRRKFFEVSDVQMPAVILLPDRKRALPFKRVEDAVYVYGLVRKEYEVRLGKPGKIR